MRLDPPRAFPADRPRGRCRMEQSNPLARSAGARAAGRPRASEPSRAGWFRSGRGARHSWSSAVLAGLVALASGAHPAAGQASWELYQVGAVSTSDAPTVDGYLDEAVWQNGGLVSEFVQQEPDEGEGSTERTDVRLLFDAKNLYIGVWAYDSDPDAVTATEMRRDSDRILQEDNFQIILDTFKDSRSAFMFVTNPLGAKLDQQVFNEGEGGIAGFGNSANVNRDWDGVWHVVARRTSDGWVAEIVVPMVTLRFPEAEAQSWGFNLMRNIARKNEQAYWAPIPQAYTLTRVSLAGSLNGLAGLNRGLDLRVTPFVTSGASRVLEEGVTDESFERDAGLDLKYGLTAGLNLDLTVNTDFAQVEVDDEQVNLTRFALFFPEKRDFFLENSGQFSVGSATAFNRIVDLFFSRRIGLSPEGESVPITAGARMTGKVGRNDIAVMNVRTDGAFGVPDQNFFVSRYSRSFLSRSRVGGMFISKDDIGGPGYNRTYALDMSLAPHPSLTVMGFVGKTQTPDLDGDDMGGYLNATWLDARWRIYGEYADLEDNFNPEVGFVPRTGITMTKLHLERNPRPDWLGIRVLSPMVNWTYYTDQTGRKVSTRWHFMNGTRFDNGAYFNVWYNRYFERLDDVFTLGGVPIPAGDYTFGEWRFSFNSNPARRMYYSLVYAPQTFYDGRRQDGTVSLGARITDRLSAEARYSRNEVDLANGNFDVDLAALRVDLALSPTVSLRSITQYNSQSDQFGASARFRWTYQPGSDIYLTYDEVRRDPRDPTGLSEFRDRRLIVKATYLLSR
jgi:hypothetical protein